MNRTMVLLGLMLCALGAAVLIAAAAADPGRLLSPDMAWAEGSFRVAGLLFGGLGLAGGVALVGIGAGHWRRPVPVGDRKGQEGLRDKRA